MKLIFLVLVSFNAFADDVHVGDLVMIATEMPKAFYSGGWVVERGLAPTYANLQKSKQQLRSEFELANDYEPSYDQLKTPYNPEEDRASIFRVTELVTDDYGAVQAVLRNANLWLVDRSGRMGEVRSARMRSLNYAHFKERPTQVLAGELNPEGPDIHVVAIKYLRAALDSLEGMSSGKIVVYRSPKVTGQKAVGIVRMLFSDGRALIYPLSVFGELRRMLGSYSKKTLYIEPTFSPDLVQARWLAPYLGPLFAVKWDPLYNNFEVERKYYERVQDSVARFFCDQILNPMPRTPMIPSGSPGTEF